MVESLKELQTLCQKPNYKRTGNWMVRTFLRDWALPMTWLLLHTPVTANQITGFALVLGITGALLLAFPGYGFLLAGALLLQLWYYFDHVDGQIARYRGTQNHTGRFLDYLMHHLVHAVLCFALTLYGYCLSGSFAFLLGALFSLLGIFSFNLIHDIKYKAFVEGLAKKTAFIIRTPQEGEVPPPKKLPFPNRIYACLHKGCEVHVMMNIVTLAAVLQPLTKGIDLRLLLALGYGLGIPFLAVSKILYLVRTRAFDSEFEQLFESYSGNSRHDSNH